MRKNLAILTSAAAAVLALGAEAHATLLVYEGFTYSTGALSGDNGGIGWAGGWTGSQYASAAGTVSAPIGSVGSNPVSGNAAEGADYAYFGQRSFLTDYDTGLNYATGGPGIPYDFSFLVDFGMETSGSINAGFQTTGNSYQFNFAISTLTGSTTVNMSIPGDPSGATIALQPGTTYLIAGVFNTVFPTGPYSGETQINVSAYSNGSSIPATTPTTWGLSYTDTHGSYNSSAISGFAGPASNSGSDITLDEIRLGTTWADVAAPSGVPEPACAGLICLGAGALLRRRRRANLGAIGLSQRG